MITTKEVGIIYETLLTSPGMNDNVKIGLRIPRKNVLLLAKIIELGLSIKDENAQNGLLSIAGPKALEELENIAQDMLTKAGLTEMYNKLQSLQAK